VTIVCEVGLGMSERLDDYFCLVWACFKVLSSALWLVLADVLGGLDVG